MKVAAHPLLVAAAMGLLGPAALIDDERDELPELRLEDDEGCIDCDDGVADAQLPEWATDVTFERADFDRVEAEWQAARLRIDTTV